MVDSDADLCNIALGLVGVTDEIDSLDEGSPQAQACKRHYAQVRDGILRKANWKFANKRVDLALLGTSGGTGIQRTGWGFVYAAPTDFVRSVRLWPPPNTGGSVFNGWPPPGGLLAAGFNSTIRALRSDQRVPFEFGTDVLVKGSYIIMTDLQFASLEYIGRVSTAALFPDAFVDAVAAELAVRLALTIPKKMQLAQMLKPAAKSALFEAMALEANLGTEDNEPDSVFIGGR